jgi:hypothetical protein
LANSLVNRETCLPAGRRQSPIEDFIHDSRLKIHEKFEGLEIKEKSSRLIAESKID